ncbi:MAG: sigma-54-dependent Fis family transcriptional regulator [Desulfobacterales bacterium]|nr:sigma-54-dependent Fis family transcriptional regulator [Desulfobacterales bacterium]
MTGKILIVDDEKDMLMLLERILGEETDHEIATCANPIEALERIDREPFDLVLTDLKMPGMSGIVLLEAIRRNRPETAVIIMTAYATIDTAVEAIHKGASDYITKPFRRERVLLTIEKAMRWRDMVRENHALRQALAETAGTAPLVGTSPAMKRIFSRVRQVAPTTATVLITGPSGTGKELVARAIHRNSLRAEAKLITVNCTALPENVLESELFGHVKGAFTGAWKDKKGLVEEAGGGTLFLDEIGDLNPLMQTKLLRLLQDGEFKPVGSVTTRRADLRFIAATNRDLRQGILDKTFREDLFYRLNVVNIDLPPLEARRSDIAALSRYFLQKINAANAKNIDAISPEAMNQLMTRSYPGNVRELENLIERGVIFCIGNVLTEEDLFGDDEARSAASWNWPDPASLPFKEAREQALLMFHRHYIESLLQICQGNISRGAETAGVQRQYLHRLMKEAGVNPDDYRQRGRD